MWREKFHKAPQGSEENNFLIELKDFVFTRFWDLMQSEIDDSSLSLNTALEVVAEDAVAFGSSISVTMMDAISCSIQTK